MWTQDSGVAGGCQTDRRRGSEETNQARRSQDGEGREGERRQCSVKWEKGYAVISSHQHLGLALEISRLQDLAGQSVTYYHTVLYRYMSYMS